MSRPRVVLLRGHSANPWELGAWEPLRDRYEVTVAVSRHNLFDVSRVELPTVRARTLRDLMPPGRAGDLAVHLPGDRYRGLEALLEGADIVHSVEIGTWFARQPAELKRRLGFRLVLTVWGTIPYLDHLLDPVRARHWRRERQLPIHEADLFLATTERARRCLLLDGADPSRIEVAWPGVDVARFAAARDDGAARGDSHLVVSPGRLVWEKGHHDVLRALAAVGGGHRLQIVGSGPQRDRLLRYASDLGVADRVEIGPMPYERMPEVFANASVVVLASLATPVWEEQFGMVLAEAIAAGAPIVAASSGAIPEVLEGSGAELFSPGDWVGLADRLGARLAGPPGARADYPGWLVERYSNAAAAERLALAYERVLA
jgi:glycosyltransferase involved in cell wall biosynthesis